MVTLCTYCLTLTNITYEISHYICGNIFIKEWKAIPSIQLPIQHLLTQMNTNYKKLGQSFWGG